VTKTDFQQYKKQGSFPKSIFREYFEEMCDTEWNEMSFMIYVENQSFMNRRYLTDIINRIIIPYYNEKFKIHTVSLLDKDGVLIKELNEISEEN